MVLVHRRNRALVVAVTIENPLQQIREHRRIGDKNEGHRPLPPLTRTIVQVLALYIVRLPGVGAIPAVLEVHGGVHRNPQHITGDRSALRRLKLEPKRCMFT